MKLVYFFVYCNYSVSVYDRERAGVKVRLTEGGLELIVSGSELISLAAHVLCKEV